MIKKTKLVHDVYVGHNGVVFDKNREVIFCDPRLKDINAESYFENNAGIIPVGGEWLYMLSIWNLHVWGHLKEDLVRLKPFQDNHNVKILRNRSHFTSWKHLGKEGSLLHHLSCFGYGHARQMLLNLTTPGASPLYRVEQLHLPDVNTPSTHLTAEELTWLRDNWIDGIRPSNEPTGHDRVYIPRPLERRGVLNDDQVREYLTKHGFYILEGNINFEQQIRIFRDATTIIGPHGAAFHNVLFCENYPTIVEFMPHNRSVDLFSRTSKTLRSANHIIKKTPGDSKHRITIDINELSAFV
jgi:hypothetical protein